MAKWKRLTPEQAYSVAAAGVQVSVAWVRPREVKPNRKRSGRWFEMPYPEYTLDFNNQLKRFLEEDNRVPIYSVRVE